MSMAHGGELVARTLRAQGVGTIYTLCGGHIAPIYTGCVNNGIALLDFRHEQAAAHAADAAARLTRNVGVAVVTAGPGVTDAVTGVANAYQARSPLVLIGGAAPLATRGRGALQEMPQVALFRSFTKASFTVERTETIPARLAEAFEAALGGRPGPVFVELPFDVLMGVVEAPAIPQAVPRTGLPLDRRAVAAIAELMRQAQRPLLVAGTQVYWDDAAAALRRLAEQTALPVFTNGAGRGTLPMRHPSCFKAARGAALREADLVLLVGTPLDFRLKYGARDFNPEAKLVQVENDRAELNHNRTADVALLADARLLLEALSDALAGQRWDGWRERVRTLETERSERLVAYKALADQPVNHFRLGAAIDRVLDEQTIVVADGGDVVSAAAKVIDLSLPGQWLDPGPLGTLGVGLPFAIAAQQLFPDKRVLVLSGDGSFGLNGFELDTAVRFGLPIVTVVGNDAGWGQIRAPLQGMMNEASLAPMRLAPTRYDRIAEAFGARGELVTDPAELEPAIQRAFDSRKPTVINVPLDPEGLLKTGASTPYIV